jgi:hypothetical protein
MSPAPASLDELALAHGTDKGSDRHGFAAIYDRFLEPWRDLPITMLEIGVLEGASVRMWRDYFPAATIYGIDVAESSLEHGGDRVEIYIGDQTDQSFLDEVVAAAGSFDLIVDDGGHRPEQQLTTLLHVWPNVKPGGLYAIEDLHTSYLGHWGGRWRKPDTTVEVLKEIVDDVNLYWHQQPPTLGEVESVHFYSELCVLAKRSPASRVRLGNPAQREDLQTPDPSYPNGDARVNPDRPLRASDR